jgi:hypothetical protein
MSHSAQHEDTQSNVTNEEISRVETIGMANDPQSIDASDADTLSS